MISRQQYQQKGKENDLEITVSAGGKENYLDTTVPVGKKEK
jgi:hypothetical protein